MKAIAVILFAAGVTTAATIPVHLQARELAIRQDVAAEVIDEADAADAEAADAAAEEVDAEEVDAEAVEADAEEELDVDDLDVNEDDLAVDLNDIGDLDVNQLLDLNLNDAIDFDLLGLDADLLALGIANLVGGFFPGFIDVNSLGILDAGQLLELMVVAQTLLNLQVSGLINQAQLINIFSSGFIGNILPFGIGGQVPVNVGALGGFGGVSFPDSLNSVDDLNVDDALSVDDAAVADVAAEVEAEDDSEFTAEEVANFTR